MGLYLLWKDKGLGSQEALFQFKQKIFSGQARSRYGIGHTGTLDPFAEGVLVVGTGEGTKLMAPLGGLHKKYRAQMIIGATSVSLDSESPAQFPDSPLPLTRIAAEFNFEQFCQNQIGTFAQTPPAFSAIHVDGKRSYEWARAGVAKELKSRTAEILQCQSLGVTTKILNDQPCLEWTFEVTVSSGTYIRCLARDWAEKNWGYPGMLSALVRTAVGPFEMGGPLEPGAVRTMGLADMADLFYVEKLTAEQAHRLQSFGQWVGANRAQMQLLVESDRTVAWAEPSGKLGRVFNSDPFTTGTF